MIIRVPLPSLQNADSGGNFDIDDDYISSKVTEFKPSILQPYSFTSALTEAIHSNIQNLGRAKLSRLKHIDYLSSLNDDEYKKAMEEGLVTDPYDEMASQLTYEGRQKYFRDAKKNLLSRQNAAKSVADWLAPSPKPYKKPEGFWQKAQDKVANAIPPLTIGAAELSVLGPYGTAILNTLLDTDRASENVYVNQLNNKKSHLEALESANSVPANLSQLGISGAANALTMYLLSKTPGILKNNAPKNPDMLPQLGKYIVPRELADLSPYAQTLINAIGAAGASSLGTTAEDLLTDYRSDNPIDIGKSTERGAMSGLITMGMAGVNAFRNRKALKEMQNLYDSLYNRTHYIDVTPQNLPPDEGTAPQPPVEPNTPNAPSGSALALPYNDPLAPAPPTSDTTPNRGTVIFMPPTQVNNTPVNEYSQNLDNIKSGIYEDIKTGRIDPMEGYDNLIKFDGISQNEARDLVVKATNDKATHKNDVKPQPQSINPELEKNINARDEFYKKLYKQQQTDREALKQQRQQEQDRLSQLADYYLETDPELIDTVEKINNASPIQLKEYTKKLYPNLNPSELEGITKQDLRSALKFRITEKIKKEEERLKQIQKQKEEEAKKVKSSPNPKDPLTSFLDVVKQQPSTPQEPVQPPVPTVDTPPAPSSRMWQDPLKSNAPKPTEPVVSPLGEQPSAAPVKETNVKPQPPVVNEPAISTPLGTSPSTPPVKQSEPVKAQPPVAEPDGEDDGYVNTIAIPNGKDEPVEVDVFFDKDEKGEEYLDIIVPVSETDSDSVAVYRPNTDEFLVNPKYGQTGWVRNLEDAVRKNLKPSKQIIEAAKRGELSDGMYDTFGLEKPTGNENTPQSLPPKKEEAHVTPITTLNEKYKTPDDIINDWINGILTHDETVKELKKLGLSSDKIREITQLGNPPSPLFESSYYSINIEPNNTISDKDPIKGIAEIGRDKPIISGEKEQKLIYSFVKKLAENDNFLDFDFTKDEWDTGIDWLGALSEHFPKSDERIPEIKKLQNDMFKISRMKDKWKSWPEMLSEEQKYKIEGDKLKVTFGGPSEVENGKQLNNELVTTANLQRLIHRALDRQAKIFGTGNISKNKNTPQQSIPSVKNNPLLPPKKEEEKKPVTPLTSLNEKQAPQVVTPERTDKGNITPLGENNSFSELKKPDKPFEVKVGDTTFLLEPMTDNDKKTLRGINDGDFWIKEEFEVGHRAKGYVERGWKFSSNDRKIYKHIPQSGQWERYHSDDEKFTPIEQAIINYLSGDTDNKGTTEKTTSLIPLGKQPEPLTEGEQSIKEVAEQGQKAIEPSQPKNEEPITKYLTHFDENFDTLPDSGEDLHIPYEFYEDDPKYMAESFVRAYFKKDNSSKQIRFYANADNHTLGVFSHGKISSNSEYIKKEHLQWAFNEYLKSLQNPQKKHQWTHDETYQEIKNNYSSEKMREFLESLRPDTIARFWEFKEHLGSGILDNPPKSEMINDIINKLDKSLAPKPTLEQILEEAKKHGNNWRLDKYITKAAPTPQQPAAPTDDKSPSQKIADAIGENLSHIIKGDGQGKKLNNKAFFDISDKAFGGTQGEGKYTPKDAYDAMEMGVNQAILKSGITAQSEPHGKNLTILSNVVNSLPTQSNRTEDQIEFQQFSTPPTLAYIANWLANINKGDTVLEPSAGLGGLAVFAKNAGANLILNELDPRRAGLLESMKLGKVYRENAEHIGNILLSKLSESERPDKVVMNPPFSSTAGRIKGQRDNSNAIKHVEQALQLMKDSGRLVAILGKGTTSKPAWKDIESKYNVRAAINIDGSNYSKYGTSYDNMIVVVDKTGPTPEGGTVRGNFKSLIDIVNSLGTVRDSVPQTKKAEPKIEATSQADTSTKAAPVKEVKTTPPQIDDIPLEQKLTDDFKKAFDKHDNGRVFVRIPDLREELGWEHDMFDNVVKYLRDNKLIQLHTGDVSVDPRIAKDGFIDDNGFRFGTITWNGNDTKVTQPPQSNDKPTGAGEKPKAENKPKEEAPEPQRQLAKTARVKKNTIADIQQKSSPLKLKLKSNEEHQKDRKSDAAIEKKYFDMQDKENNDTPETREMSINSIYHPSISTGVEHPADLVESSAMASVSLPPLHYEPLLPNDMIENGYISSAQLEAVAYIGQAFTEKLNDGRIKGAFLGDGTGVGKGREIAAAIHDALAHKYGNGKAVWVSKKTGDLFKEAQGHWTAIGNDSNDLFSQNDEKACPPKQEIKKDNGILFTSYSLLSTEGRAEQVKNWLGEDYDGIIVLDECHIANNATATKGKRGILAPSKISQIILDLVNTYPKAKILYSSATGATEVRNFALYDRLGLWGQGAPFETRAEFEQAINDGGLAAMEKLIMDLKAMGLYISRSISYRAGPYGGDDDVTFSILEANIPQEQIDNYNRIAEAWRIVEKNLGEAIKVCGVGEKGEGISLTTKSKNGKISGGNPYATYRALHQRVFNQILTSFKTDTLIKDIKKQLANNKSIVIQLTTTNEAELNRAIERRMAERGISSAKDIDKDSSFYDDLDYSPKFALTDFVKASFPIYKVEAYEETRDDGETVTKYRQVTDSEGNPVISQEALQIRDELLNDIKDYEYPKSPIDKIIDEFGVDMVAEMTGRTERIVTIDGKKQKQNITPASKERDKELFLNGAIDKATGERKFKRILIFSEAGATGASYHAGREFYNQQQRIHYILEAGWSAAIAIQGMGRTHRTNQVVKPHFVLVSSGIPGEKRFVSSIARRILQLGALTSGERKNASKGIFSEKDNLESKQAIRAMEDVILTLSYDGNYDGNGRGLLKDMGIENPKTPIMTVFNRILALNIEDQKYVFDLFENSLNKEIANAIAKGELDTRTENVKAESIKLLQNTVIWEDKKYNANTRYLELELQKKTRPRTWKDVTTGQEHKSTSNGGINVIPYDRTKELEFYTDENGKIWAVEKTGNIKRIPSGENQGKEYPDVIRYSVNKRERARTNLAYFKNQWPGQMHKYKKVSTDEAKKLWEQQAANLPPTYPERMHMITGLEIPIWNRFNGISPRLVRATTDNGDVYLGRVVSSDNLAIILSRFNIRKNKSAGQNFDTPSKVREYLNGGRKVLNLGDKFKLQYSMVNGEFRLEVKGNVMSTTRSRWANDYGAIVEYIRSEPRIFIPRGNDSLLQYLLEQYPVIDTNEQEWEDYESGGIAEINSEIPDDNATNLYAINPSFRKFFNLRATPAEAAEELENDPNVEEYTPKNYQSEDSDIQKRIDEAHEQKRSVNGLFNLFTELGKDIYQSMSDIPALKGKEDTFGKAMEAIRDLRRVRMATVDELKNSFRIILHDLTPDDYNLFEAYMRVADLAETLGRDEAALLPYGYTPDTLATDYKKFSRELEKNEKVKKAVDKAEAYGEKLREDLFSEADKLGFYELRDKLSRKHYFRHLVLSFYTVKNGGEITSSSIKRVLKGGVYRRREGSELDISSNWVQAMGEAYTRIIDDTKVLRMLSKVRDEYDIIETCKEHAMQMNLEYALKKIKGDLKGINAEDKLKEELFSSQAKAISKIFELANNGDLPVGLNKEWGELVHKLTEAGQLENLDEKTKNDFARYIGWLINNDVTGVITPNMKVDKTAQRMAKRIIYSEASKRRTLKKINGNEYVKWTDLIPLDYDIFIPTDSGLVSTANSLPDNIINVAMENLNELTGVPLKDIAQSLQAGGNKQMWVLHKDLIKALNDLGKKKEQSAFGKIARKIMKGERLWALFAPVKGRFIKYNIGNFLGDFEAVLQGNPHTIKYVRRAYKELAGYFYKGTIPEKGSDLEDFVKRGGANISQSSAELIDNWDKMADFQHLLNKKGKTSLLKMPVKFINGYFEVMKHFSNYREAILRYAAYLSFKQLIEDNGGKAPFYAMSKPELVDLLEGDTPAMAFKLSNEMLGAYDEISSFTRAMLDNNILMFGAYQEVNITRSWQMYKNAWRGNSYFNYYIEKHGQKIIDNLIAGGGGGDKKPPEPPSGNGADWDDDGIGDWDDDRAWWQRWLEKLSRARDFEWLRKGLSRLAATSPILALSALGVLAIMAPLTYLARIFNWLNPNEKELPENVRESSHLALWKNPFTGGIYYLPNVGSAFTDYWTIDPQTIIFRGAIDILNGKQTFGGLVSDLASAPINRVLQNTNPLLKMTVEGLLGEKTYPDYRNRTAIRDFPRYAAQSQNLEHYYDMLMGNPVKPFNTGELFASSQSTDGSGQYWNIKSKVKEFQKKVLHTTSGFYENERSKYVRQAITALNYGYDKKHIDKYFSDYARESYITGIKDPVQAWNRSIKNLDPLNGLNERQKAQFWKWLSEDERKDFRKAKEYFKFLEGRLLRR